MGVQGVLGVKEELAGQRWKEEPFIHSLVIQQIPESGTKLFSRLKRWVMALTYEGWSVRGYGCGKAGRPLKEGCRMDKDEELQHPQRGPTCL